MSKKTVLMCPPTYFEVVSNLNPDMERTLKECRKVNKKKVTRQWESLRDIYTREGFECVYIEPVKGLPDMVFTANAALVYDDRVVIGEFRKERRQGETQHFYKWFSDQEYRIVKLPYFFEGNGDALFWQDKLFCGHGFRSEPKGLEVVASFIGKAAVIFQLVDPRFYHFDTCFCPMGERALVYPQAFKDDACKELEKSGEIIPVSEKDAMRRVCNGVYFEGKSGPKFIVNDLSKKLSNKLEGLGIEILINKTSEFQLSGGSNRCLTLFI